MLKLISVFLVLFSTTAFSLTPTQQAALKAHIEADPVLMGYPHNSDGSYAISDALAADAVPAFKVWKSDTSVSDVFDQISWANYTPVDTPDNTVLWGNRNLACQSKQFNLQTMISGRDSLPTGKAKYRDGLQDATSNLPSGASGATLSGGWLNVKQAIQRNANRLERLYVTGTGTTASPGDLVVEGRVGHQEISDIMGW